MKLRVFLLMCSRFNSSQGFDFRGAFVPLGAKSFFKAKIQVGAGAVRPSPERYYVVLQ